jgi:hypothetical protein
MTQEMIRLGLIARAIFFEPVDNIGVEAHGDGFFGGPIKLTNLGSAPINDARNIGEINVFVF